MINVRNPSDGFRSLRADRGEHFIQLCRLRAGQRIPVNL